MFKNPIIHDFQNEVEYNPMTGQKLVSARNSILSQSKHFQGEISKPQKLSKISLKKRSSLIDDPETNPMNPIVRFESPIMNTKESMSHKKPPNSLIDNPETNPMSPVVATSSPGVLLAVEDTLQNVYDQVIVAKLEIEILFRWTRQLRTPTCGRR